MTYEEFNKIREQKYQEMQEKLKNITDSETKRIILHNYNEEMRELRHYFNDED